MSGHETIYDGEGLDAHRLRDYSIHFADNMTLSHLDRLDLKPGSLVLDIGAGPSPELGRAIKGRGLNYIALDADSSSVDQQRSEGNEAILSNGTNISLESDSVTHVNARFCLAWNDKAQRREILDEIVRVSKPEGSITISEYDWSDVTGPPHYLRLVSALSSTVSAAGFDPTYGKKLGDELKAYFAHDEQRVIKEYREPAVIDSLQKLKEITAEGALSLIATLKKSQKFEEATAIQNLLDSAMGESGVNYTFPEIVTTVVSNSDQKPVRDYASSMLRIEGDDDYAVCAVENNPTLRHACRALVAARFYREGYLEDRAIEWPFLNDAVDPVDIRNRSKLFATLDESHQPIATARLIAASGGDIATLPTIARILKTHSEEVLDVFDGSVIEMSALASSAKKSLPVLALVSMMVKHARDHGLKYIIYGIVADGPGVKKGYQPNERIARMFGESIKELKTAEGTPVESRLTGPEIRDPGVTLRAGYLQVEPFYEKLVGHLIAGRGEVPEGLKLILQTNAKSLGGPHV
jgi:ubiquinone/menaquinone biosynthesis C-methylase UbiE